ncbi:ubiquitin carboxyl-terminal hydrolase 44 isoform X3 [Patella vulgata]|uniref:ubiquitin carboxyl-terminal hydrolase 44 isoform X3 n=1 Tax=Patella vulgata TaxID=6465 RepID=UPI00217FA5DC|nr:ubiquitin carboxyl-terminal hydrolase 44 isoform X3 [Patella vulgata]
MEVCSHLNKLHLGTNTTILNPEKWLCFICGTTESVWACLSCSNVACGRLNNEHALNHFDDKKHPLAIEVNNRYVYCYECDEYIYGDNKSGDLALLRDALSAITTQSFEQVESRGQRLLRSYSNTEITSRCHADENDRIATAVCHFGRVILCKVFSAWHFYVKQQKIAQEQSSTPKKRKLDIPPTPPSVRKRTLIPGVTGLRNLGNTCYMNSILQCLGHLDEFRDFILDLDFSNVWSPVGTPSARKEKMPYKPSTRTNHRLNTSDYFQHLSKPVNSPCESRNKGGLIGGGGFPSSSVQLHSSFHLNNIELLDKLEEEVPLLPEYSHHSNILADTFQGQLISQVTCLKCDNQSSTHEPYLDLSLEFPDRYQITSSNTNVSNASCHVTEMLTKFTEIEMLEGPIYACEYCNKKLVEAGDNKPSILSEACKQLLLNKLPPVLRLHLKRFREKSTKLFVNSRWSGRYHREKISTHVSFDEDLDMSPYCSDSVSWTSCTYRLSGVVVHHGWGFGSGHYTAYCWSSEAESWLNCNDSKVEFCSLGDVQKSQAYILFYTQVTTDISNDSLATPLNSFETVPCSESESFSENSLMVDEEITFNFKNSDSFQGENSSSQNNTPTRLKMKRRRTTF